MFLAVLVVANLFYLGGKPASVDLYQPPMDKLAHFGVFGLMTALVWLSMRRGNALVVIGIVTVIGAADELHQVFVPGRNPGWDDFAADVFAAITVAVFMYWARLDKEQ